MPLSGAGPTATHWTAPLMLPSQDSEFSPFKTGATPGNQSKIYMDEKWESAYYFITSAYVSHNSVAYQEVKVVRES